MADAENIFLNRSGSTPNFATLSSSQIVLLKIEKFQTIEQNCAAFLFTKSTKYYLEKSGHKIYCGKALTIDGFHNTRFQKRTGYWKWKPQKVQ